ncbi:hypothetical protein SLE2022_021000 [Rubroshorea leprosula]
MGCVASRPVMMPQRLEPLFFRKLEEIRGLTTLSKKQLLKDGVEDEHSRPFPNNENDRRSASYETEGSAKEVLSHVEEDGHSIPNSYNENDQSASPESEGPAKVALALVEDDEHARPSSNNKNNQRRASAESEGSANATPESLQLEEVVPEEDVVEAVMPVIEKMATEETDAEGDNEEEDGVICIDGALLSPGSPSFRVYCMDTLENEEDDGKEDDIKTEDSVASDIVEPSNSSEGTVAEKKQKKGRKFRTILPKGKPVKNLLKVKSCYYPACGRSQRDSPLKAAKEPLLDDNR